MKRVIYNLSNIDPITCDSVFLPTGFILSENGNVIPCSHNEKNSIRIKAGFNIPFPFVYKNNFSQIFINQLNHFFMADSISNGSAIASDVNIVGNYGQHQNLSYAIGQGTGQEWTVSMQNLTTEKISLFLFDGHTLCWAFKGLDPLPPTTDLLVDGTFGVDTMAFFKTITLTNPVRLKRLHVSVKNSEQSIAQLNMNISNAAPDFSGVDARRISFVGAVTPDQFNSKIQIIESFDALVDGLVGIYVEVPAEETVILNFKLDAIQRVYGMKKAA